MQRVARHPADQVRDFVDLRGKGLRKQSIAKAEAFMSFDRDDGQTEDA